MRYTWETSYTRRCRCGSVSDNSTNGRIPLSTPDLSRPPGNCCRNAVAGNKHPCPHEALLLHRVSLVDGSQRRISKGAFDGSDPPPSPRNTRPLIGCELLSMIPTPAHLQSPLQIPHRHLVSVRSCFRRHPRACATPRCSCGTLQLPLEVLPSAKRVRRHASSACAETRL